MSSYTWNGTVGAWKDFGQLREQANTSLHHLPQAAQGGNFCYFDFIYRKVIILTQNPKYGEIVRLNY